jgi:hypothetical protein
MERRAATKEPDLWDEGGFPEYEEREAGKLYLVKKSSLVLPLMSFSIPSLLMIYNALLMEGSS